MVSTCVVLFVRVLYYDFLYDGHVLRSFCAFFFVVSGGLRLCSSDILGEVGYDKIGSRGAIEDIVLLQLLFYCGDLTTSNQGQVVFDRAMHVFILLDEAFER